MPPSKKGPTLRSQWLGKHLRELRESAGLTLRDAGDYVQRDQGAISRWETGIVPARVPDVLALLNLYGVHDPAIRNALEQLSRDIWQKGWWDDYARETKTRVIDLAWLESRARRTKMYKAVVLDGLLQTRDYAREIMTANRPDYSPAKLERWLEFRASRQRKLTDDDPLLLDVVLDEATLRRMVGGAKVMRAQFAHLEDLAERPNITIRVLPFDAGAHASPLGAFTIFEMPEPYPDASHIETEAGSIYLEAESVERFALTYDCLLNSALPPEQSLAFIRALAERLSR
ncbi:Helix-turn-helix domain-containing protein [Thermomonospora echinospora]|uniref:Helix-turn-helix domain-containing protein n=1 Tax=Thermomonospora echinospora TaxID=1992 RepID=A0A1H6AGG0_9ACTN|nr:helix-turn-helix transcriptional regulator [Thermomonospora echinospora]SEG47320.1 Helix-turn-helix domain-containing protein [Thermomonospora echinospora]